jgi:hypothetical protein
MLKSFRNNAALALALSMSAGLLTSLPAAANDQDDRPPNDYKIATIRDMTVPDEYGEVIVKRDARKILSCTSDDRFILTYVFPLTAPQYKKSTSPEKIDAYLNQLSGAFASASRAHSASVFNVGQRYPLTLPPKVFQRLEATSQAFNKANGTALNWVIRSFITSDEPYQPCIDSRLKKPAPSR